MDKLCSMLLILGATNGEFVKTGFLPTLQNLVMHGDEECSRESLLYRENLKNYSQWAYDMYDSSAKGSSGVLRGNNYQFGNYDQCLKVLGPFPTQYCLVTLTLDVPVVEKKKKNSYGLFFTKLQKPTHFRHQRSDHVFFGLCVPASCKASDIQNSSNELLDYFTAKQSFGKNVQYSVLATDSSCESSKREPRVFGAEEVGFWACTALLVFLVLLATTIDYLRTRSYGDESASVTGWIIWSFSVRTSWKCLFQIHDNNRETKIFDCVRVVSVILVVLGHLVEYGADKPMMNGEKIDQLSDFRFGILVEQLDLVVNTFFVVGALMLSYGLLKKSKDTQINPFKLIVMRYIRLTPLNAYVTFYFVTAQKLSGSGSMWTLLGFSQSEGCSEYWWLNLLYLNNFFIDFRKICNFVTWYISCDFQLFIVSLLVMCVFQKYRNFGSALLVLLLAISIGAPMYVTEMYNISPVGGKKKGESYYKFLNDYYMKPYSQGSSYIVGLLGGIAYHRFINRETKLNANTSYVITIISSFFMIFSSTYLFFFFFDGRENFPFETALYNSLHRFFWSVGVMGIFLVISFGSFPFLKTALSSSAWTPLSRLTYGAYLIQMVVLLMPVGGTISPLKPTVFGMIRLVVSDTFLCFAISFLLFIFVEAPFANIFKRVRGNKKNN